MFCDLRKRHFTWRREGSPLHLLQRWPFFTGLGVVISPPISEAFAFGSFDRRKRAGGIIDAKGDAMVPLEGDFVDVALQVVFAYRVMRAVHLAFDDRMEALCRIDMNEAAKSHIFISRVIDARMSAVIARWPDVDLAFIGHEIGRFINAGVEVFFDILRGDVRNVLRTHFTVALNERHNGVLLRLRLAVMDVLLFAADIGLIAFDNLVAAGPLSPSDGVIASRMRISRNHAVLY